MTIPSITKEELKNVLKGKVPEYNADLPLFSQIDSVQLVSLVLELERILGTKFDISIFNKKNLISLDSLLSYMEKNLGNQKETG